MFVISIHLKTRVTTSYTFNDHLSKFNTILNRFEILFFIFLYDNNIDPLAIFCQEFENCFEFNFLMCSCFGIVK